MSTFHPFPWSEFSVECLLYFAFMGVLHFVAFLVGYLILEVLNCHGIFSSHLSNCISYGLRRQAKRDAALA